MARRVVFFYVRTMAQENDQARHLLNAMEREGLSIEDMECEETMALRYTCPFVRDETEHRNYYGLQGIESFAENLKAAHQKERRRGRSSSTAVAA